MNARSSLDSRRPRGTDSNRYAVYTTYTAHSTIPSVYAGAAPDAFNDVAAYRNPFPTTSGPNLLSGRRHHVYSPTTTYDATMRARQTASDVGATRIGLRATAHAVTPVAMVPAIPTATITSTRWSARSLRRISETEAVVTGRERSSRR